jgi:REP element-mobilizing transposase RayT
MQLSQQKQTYIIAPFRGTSKTIGSIVRGFKIGVTKWFRKMNPGMVIWQRNYYDHIIRDEKSLYLVRKYIHKNPENWYVDSENHINREIQEITINNTGNAEENKRRT